MLGEITSLLSHQVYKNGYKPQERWKHLQEGVPDFLEEPRVLKTKQLIKQTINVPDDIRVKQLETIKEKVLEEIELEANKPEPDHYVIRQLSDLLNQS